ncbi:MULTISPECIES: hypothetical protein [unclassified Methylobacterium]|uniref:hypothetical protein n=1 Tax=unclassified Methylobacterium TaxID=2615210 RepID=UPI00226A2744|nr:MULTISPECIES: hypothetical protein [unclassified Methylobacterium]
MAITAISVLRRDPALANASGLIAGATGPSGAPGAPGIQGQAGQPGQAGSPGPTGRGVSSVTVDGSSHLIVSYTDGSSSDAGPVTVATTAGVDGGTF